MCRFLLSLLALSLAPAFLLAQDPILLAEPPPQKMLHSFLLKEAQKLFDVRRETVAKLKTPDEIKARQEYLKKKFLEAIGDLPEKTPLNAKVTKTIKGDGFRIECVIFESRPDHHVTGNIYIPDGLGPFPGIIVPCGHSSNGKADGGYQRGCMLMAKNGMVAFSYDPIGQGERLQLLNKDGKAGIPGSTSEHTMVGVGALLVGRCTAHYRIWDGIRALDYLASRPEVDPKRLGCTGNSGGGTMTAYLMALDDRIACAVPSCYICSLERLFATIGPQDGEQNIPGQVAFGMEHADYLTMRAPRPTLMTVATQDFFDIKGAHISYKEAAEVYKKLGAADKMAIFEYDDKHGWSKPRREASMRWMRKWLLGKDDEQTEPAFTTFKDEDLQCTRTGQVLSDLRGVSVFDLNARRDRELAKERAKFVALERNEQEELVRRLLAVPKGVTLRAKSLVSHAKDTVFITEAESGLRLPGVERKGTMHKPSRMVLRLDDGGLSETLKTGRLDVLAKDFDRVVALEVRGVGETAPGKMKGGKPGYFGIDVKESFLAMHLGRPLLGQRVVDLRRFLPLDVPDLSRDRVDEVHLSARGPITALVALHAAALNPKVKSVTLEEPLLSWSNVVQTPVSYNQLTNVVPGVLAHYDLPELATMIAPRPLTIRHPLDAAGNPVSQKVLEETYRVTRERYEALKAGAKLKLEAK